MQTTTANYDTAIKAVTREIRAYLKFNGSTIVRGVDGLISIKWNQELSDTERFSIGQAVSSYIDTELYSTAVSGVTLETSYIDAYIGVVLSYANSMPVGSIENDYAVVEYVPLGRFYVNTVEKAKNTVRITAYDAMSKLAVDYTTTVTPGGSGYAITDIANDVLTQCGISGSVSGSHGYATAISPGTCRDQLGWCCSMIYSNGSSYLINRANNTLTNTTVIGQNANQYTITDAVIYLDGADIQPNFTITSVEATAGANTYSYGTGVGVVTSNPYITTAQTQAIYNSLKNFTYTPMKIEFRGDPKIDVGDVITVTTGGTSYTCVVMRLLNTFNGGLKTTIYCYGNSEEYYEMSQSPTGARIIQTQDMVRIEAQRATDAEGALQSSITTNANNITLAVSNTPIVNLLPTVYYSEAASGNPYETSDITFTLNADGSVTATGTASGNAFYTLANSNLTSVNGQGVLIDPSKKYYLSGCPSGGTSSTYELCARLYNEDGTQGTLGREHGSGMVITPASTSKYLYIYIAIRTGYACPEGGITFYPMLEVGNVGHTYQSTHNGSGAMMSAIEQNAHDITLKVSETDVTGNYVIGKINLNSTTATIAAEHINLQGAVTISDLNSTAKSTLQTGTAVKNQYYISTSSSSATGGSWADTTSAWSSGKYVWTRVVTTKTYADGNSTTTNGTAVYDANLTSALSTANTAASDASTAITNAATAQTTANNAIANTPVVNLLPSVYRREAVSGATWSRDGITWTVNADGSVTASGTATANVEYNLSANNDTAPVPWIPIDPAKKHTMSGVPNVTGCQFRVAVYSQNGTGQATYTIDTTDGNGTSKVIPTSDYYRFAYAYLRILSGTAIPNGVTFYPMLEVGDTAHAYISTHNGSGAIMASAVKSTVSCYYRSTTSTTPTISTSTTIGTAADTSNAWEYVMPQPKSGCYFFTCEKYTYADGSVAFSTVRQIANATYTSLWCSSADSTYIDGGHIYTGSLTADKIKANETFTQKLYAQDFNITGGSVNIQTASQTDDVIQLNRTDSNNYTWSNLMSPWSLTVDSTAYGFPRYLVTHQASSISGYVNGWPGNGGQSGFTLGMGHSSTRDVTSSLTVSAVDTSQNPVAYTEVAAERGTTTYQYVSGTAQAASQYKADGIVFKNTSANKIWFNMSESLTMWENGVNKYSALIWPDSNGAGRFVLGDGASTLWRTQLDNTGLTFRDANDAVTASYPADRANSLVSTMQSTAVFVPSTTSGATSITSITLGIGLWMLCGTAQFPQNTSGFRLVVLSKSSDSSTSLTGYEVNFFTVSSQSVSPRVQVMGVYNASASTTIYLNARQNSGSALNTTGNLFAVRIG